MRGVLPHPMGYIASLSLLCLLCGALLYVLISVSVAVCVCSVPPPKSKTKTPVKPKLGRNSEVKRSMGKVTRPAELESVLSPYLVLYVQGFQDCMGQACVTSTSYCFMSLKTVSLVT